MTSTILYFMLAIWTVAGGIAAVIFYCDEILPATNRYKNIIGIIACGPAVWIIRPLIVGGKKLGGWLCRDN